MSEDSNNGKPCKICECEVTNHRGLKLCCSCMEKQLAQRDAVIEKCVNMMNFQHKYPFQVLHGENKEYKQDYSNLLAEIAEMRRTNDLS